MKKHPVSISAYSDPSVIAALSAELERHNIAALDIETGDGNVAIAIHARSADIGHRPATAPAAPDRSSVLAKAPIAGRFLPEHPLRPDGAVKAGMTLSEGQIAGLIAVGPVLVPALCETKGIAAPPCAEPGALIGYGASLIKART